MMFLIARTLQNARVSSFATSVESSQLRVAAVGLGILYRRPGRGSGVVTDGSSTHLVLSNRACWSVQHIGTM